MKMSECQYKQRLIMDASGGCTFIPTPAESLCHPYHCLLTSHKFIYMILMTLEYVRANYLVVALLDDSIDIICSPILLRGNLLDTSA